MRTSRELTGRVDAALDQVLERDIACARQYVGQLAGVGAREALAIVHLGLPVAKGRPRWDDEGRRMYTPGRTRAAEKDLIQVLRLGWRPRPPMTDSLALVALFYVPTLRRVDLDNLSKLVMDAATRARLWKDDSQVKRKTVVMELDRARPRTVIAIAPCASTMTKAPLFAEEIS